MDRRSLRLEFEELLIDEAWLLDTDQLEAWLELFADDLRYWAPVRANLGRDAEHLHQPHLLAHFDDDRMTLGLRVARLRTGMAHAEEPPSRIRHCVSNVKILDDSTADRVHVASNVMIFRGREGRDEHLFVAQRRDWWRREATGWRCSERFVLVDHDVIENITVFF
jgi:phthalate 3,4-dioxygenase subunit beta